MANRPIPIPSPAAESADDDIRRIGLVFLSVLALVVGIVTGFGAVGFRDLIGLIHNGLFLGQFAVRYDANLFTPPSPWGAFVILVPVIGALAVHLPRGDGHRRGAGLGEISFDTFLAKPEHHGRMRHVAVFDGNRIIGVFRVNTALRRASEGAQSTVTLGDIASRNFTIVREDDIVFDVIRRIWRRQAVMALVVRRRGVPRPADVAALSPRNTSPTL